MTLRDRLRQEHLTGALLTIPDPAVAFVLADSGFDVVVLDGEHAPFTAVSMAACCDAAKLGGASVLVRVPGTERSSIRQALETGADGVLVPSVRSVLEAELAVELARFPPEGSRGVGISRATGYGARLAGALEPDAAPAVLVMLEDGPSIALSAEIAATDGLDGVVVGPVDLAVSLGRRPSLDATAVLSECDAVLASARAAGVAAGAIGRPGDASRWRSAGATFLVCLVDVVALGTAAREALATARGEAG